MAQNLDFLQNIISPHKEMAAYETLWAMEDIILVLFEFSCFVFISAGVRFMVLRRKPP